ncbi:MAG: DUF115 domain-containing protein [Lachnospiraceae bacterium]|nr:DUF115 domain-containing protein [Lachnospiraceae bacterium]
MAEQWLEEIYVQAHIIQDLHEIVRYIHISENRTARALYNCTASKLEDLITEISKSDINTAVFIQDCAVKVTESWEDPFEAAGQIESALLPALFNYIKIFTDISVEDGNYLIKSSSSGFLTIKDLKTQHYLHDTYDPLYEAYQLALHLYKPDMKSFRIFGVGLGYLPYMLWHVSDMTLHIYVYENDSTILDYADRFGTLSKIDDDCLTIIHDSSMEKLANAFSDDIHKDREQSERYVTPWKSDEYAHVNNGMISRLKLIDDSSRSLRKISTINLWKNKTIPQADIISLYKNDPIKEYVIVAAGPSFDDSIDFIKDSIGKRTVIAVNTVLRRLNRENIKPDLSVAADPYEQICEHIKDILPFTSQIPLIADKITYWKYCQIYRGEKYFVATEADRKIPGAVSNDEQIWEVGGTVSSLAIEAAIKMGAEVIHMIGLDLAYPSGINYAKDMPHARMSDTPVSMEVPSTDGGMVGTSETFDIFRRYIEYQISHHQDICFINHSMHGAMIQGSSTII